MVQNISIQNVVARNAFDGVVVTVCRVPVRRVAVDGTTARMLGGEQKADGFDVPEKERRIRGHMFGTLPGFGFYARHADGLTLTNVHTRWRTDARPAMCSTT